VFSAEARAVLVHAYLEARAGHRRTVGPVEIFLQAFEHDPVLQEALDGAGLIPDHVRHVAEWHVIVTEGIRGTRDHGVIGNDDIQARTVETKNGSVPEVLLFPKVLYTPEEAAQWTEHHAMPWIRVEG
jgi:hypothetical protein